ncbi:MAG: PIN domain nuclease of toxin-antitoxin system [Akkermansiaceae bacterium]|jgi:PIN domain nuclease of toxin-antitoxin system
MSYLLDTCAWIDALLAPEKLSPKAKKIIGGPELLYLSSISLLEFSRKEADPKGNEEDIILSIPAEDWLTKVALPPSKIKVIDLTSAIVLEAYRLPGQLTHRGKRHKDPADLIITATARLHEFTLLTSDRILLDYPHVNTLNSRE